MNARYTVDLKDVDLAQINVVGGKNASLGEMIKNLSNLGISIPLGFAITVEGYWRFLQHNKLEQAMVGICKEIDMDNLISLRKGGTKVRQLIRQGKFPNDLQEEILEQYHTLSKTYGQ